MRESFHEKHSRKVRKRVGKLDDAQHIALFSGKVYV